MIPVDGTFADWWACEEPFDRAIADWGADRLEWVRDGRRQGSPCPRTSGTRTAATWCEFFSLCRAQDDPDEGEEITDPELAAAVAAYGEANSRSPRPTRRRSGSPRDPRPARHGGGLAGVHDPRAGEEDEVPDAEADGGHPARPRASRSR